MKLPEYSFVSLGLILGILATASFAADNAADKPVPKAVPAAEQAKASSFEDVAAMKKQADLAADNKAKADAEAKAAAEKVAAEKAKKDAETKAAAEKAAAEKAAAEKAKAEADAKAAAEKAKKDAEAKAAAEKAAAEKAKKDAEAKAAAEKAAAEKAAAEKAKKDAEAKAAAEKAAAEKAAAEKAKKDAEAKAAAEKAKAEAEAKATAEEKKKAAEEKVATAFEKRFPELAKAIADADLSAEKKAEVDVLSANLMASSDALDEVVAREAAGNAQPAEKLEAEIECLTNYTAILAAVPSPETEAVLADKQLELHTAREDRLLLAQQDFEAGRIDSAQLLEVEEKYLKIDMAAEAEPVKAAKAKERKEPFWGYKKHKPLPVLVIVANYRIPRKVIAEYLRTKYDVPYILLPSDPGKPSKDDQVFFSGGKKNSGDLEVALPAPKLSQFIAYLRPETVIFLGNDSYINPVYRLAVPESIRKVEFSDAEWKVNTARLDEFFRRTLKTDVSDHYLDYLQNQDKHNAE